MKTYSTTTLSEVTKEYPLYQSEKGNYFIGQTPIISGQSMHALASLTNPVDSKVKIYVNAMTLTNISNINLSAEFYLKSTFNNGIVSPLVSSSNTTITP
ncbi:MAG: DUF6143 family protein, partial [Peptostreptococcaceae bacterium]